MALSFNPTTIPDIVIKENQVYKPYILPEAIGASGLVEYKLLPGLPNGISFNPDNRVLTLNPVTPFILTEYTYSARDDTDSGSLMFNLQVNPETPQNILDLNLEEAIIQEEDDDRFKYSTVEGETLAGVIYRHYKVATQEILKEVFEVNPNLLKYPLILPQGVEIILPEINTSEEIQPIALWD